MKHKNIDVMSQFNLPSYLKGKSFSKASSLIAEKFKDRNSPEDIATMNDIQGRLRQAQEFVKAKQEERNKPLNDSGSMALQEQLGGQHQMPDGSMMPGAEHQEQPMRKGGKMLTEMYEGGGDLDKKDESWSGQSDMSKAGSIVGAAGTAMELGQMAFGDTGIDTSGLTAAPEVQSTGMSAATGAVKGAATGAQFGPWGAAIGGVLGGAAGFLGGSKANRAAQEAATSFTYGQHNNESNNYKKGGELDSNSYYTGDPIDFQAANDTARKEETRGQPLAQRPVASLLSSIYEKRPFEDMNVNQDMSDSNLKVKTPDADVKKDKFNAAELLRYAPAAMNLSQLANLKKPGQTGLDRLGNRYNEQRVDERGLQNAVQNSVDNNRDAILSSSGGSGSAARSNLLASQLQGSKAMSGAYQAATGENRKDNIRGQQFNADIDKVNIGQSNQETSLNLQQQAGYISNKSKLMSQLGNDLGGIGQEELFKRYPKMMGLSYGSDGKHLLKKERDKALRKYAREEKRKKAKEAKNNKKD